MKLTSALVQVFRLPEELQRPQRLYTAHQVCKSSICKVPITSGATLHPGTKSHLKD